MTQTRADSTFETILDHVLPFAGPVLIPDEGPLRAAARQLPPIPNGMLEIRLEPDSEQVDLVVGFHAHQFPLFAQWQRESRSSNSIHLDKIANALTAEGSYLRETTSAFGLEYDLIEVNEGNELPVPAIFFMPDKQQIADHNDLYAYVQALLPAALNTGADEVLLSNTKKVLDILDKKNVVHTLGIMLSRQRQALRLQVERVHSNQLGAVFTTAGFTKSPPGLVELIELSNLIGLQYLTCLDMAPYLQPAIGLELNDISTKPKQVLDEILNLLVEKKLCCARKRRVIESWHGSSIPQTLPREWEAEPPFPTPPTGRRRFFVKIGRRISHIKIMLHRNNLIEAKIYLEFYPEVVELTV